MANVDIIQIKNKYFFKGMIDKLINKASFGSPIQKGKVTIFPAATPETLKGKRGRKIRAVAYVRVSTDSTQQETSLALQNRTTKVNPSHGRLTIFLRRGNIMFLPYSATTKKKDAISPLPSTKKKRKP